MVFFFLGATLVPVGVRSFNQARDTAEIRRVASNERVWYVSERQGSPPTVLRIERVDRDSGDLKGITIFPMDDNFRPKEQIVAARGEYEKGSGWKFYDAHRRQFSGLEMPKLEHADEVSIDLPETPAQLLEAQRPSEEMTWTELNRQIEKIGKHGRSADPYRVERHARFAIPLAAVALILVGAPLAIRPVRSGGLAVSILGAIVLGFAYFVVIAMLITMGKGNLLPPWAAAWSANIIFGVMGGIYFSTMFK